MYSTSDEIEAALSALAAAYPSVTTLHSAPHPTHRNRTVHILRIGADPANDGVAILGGVHAREWMPPEVCVSLAADLLEAHALGTGLRYGGAVFSAADVARVMSTLCLYVFACVNPDGRVWSQTAEALWRKNRRPGAPGGVDINRNFDFLWDHTAKFAADANVATSSDPAHLTYRGPSAASEPETKNVVWMLDTFPVRWLVDVHSAVPVVLHSWGSDTNQSSDPNMNFRNPVYDAVRGRAGDAVGEYIPVRDADAGSRLAQAMATAVLQVRGTVWPAEQAMTLYPTSGASDDYSFSRHFTDASRRAVLAWTIECGTVFQPPWAEAVEVISETSAALLRLALDARQVTDGTSVTLETPAVHIEAEAGTTLARPVVFTVAESVALSLEVVSVTGGFWLPLGTSLAVPAPGFGATATASVWIAWTAGDAGATVAGAVTIRCAETAQEWIVAVTASASEPVRTAIVLALDESGSMTGPAGDGRTKAEVLREAGAVFAAVLHPDDVIGMVAFATDARTTLTPVPVGAEVFGAGRAALAAALATYVADPSGLTSIGDAVTAAQALVASAAGVNARAVLVFTDGQQTAPSWIADVVPGERTFAVGLGTPAAIDPAALTALTDGTGGYVTVTGDLSIDERFVLSEYFLRVLAGATNAQIVQG